jgi:hypothetical protein
MASIAFALLALLLIAAQQPQPASGAAVVPKQQQRRLAGSAEPVTAAAAVAAPPVSAAPSFDAFVGLLAASGQHVADDYARVFNYTHNLAPPYAANGVAYTGANLRLRRVVAKLLRGEPTKIVVIGGSISWWVVVVLGGGGEDARAFDACAHVCVRVCVCVCVCVCALQARWQREAAAR